MPKSLHPETPVVAGGRGRLPAPRSAVGARWVFPAGLSAMVAGAVWVRAAGLGRTGLSSDEAVYIGQGAAVAGDPSWSAVRAHPPLFGFLIDAVTGGGTGDLGPRSLSVALGVAAVVIAALLARELGGVTAGLTAGAVVALMPYHRDVTRLALVDVPMATAAGLGLLLLVRGARAGRPGLVAAAGAAFGVAVLFKETALLTVLAVALALVVGDPRVPTRVAVRAAFAFAGVVALYPVWLASTGGLGPAAAYATWQAGRHGTDPIAFYLDLVAPRVGWAVLAAAGVGAVVAGRARLPGATAVALAAVVPLGFYLVWPVHGYPYLLATVIPLAALVGVTVAALAERLRHGPVPRVAPWVLALGVALVGPAAAGSRPPEVPGAGGVAGLREAASWLRANDAGTVVTAAPWVANIVRHYAPGASVTSLAGPDDPEAVNPAYRSRPVDLPPGHVLVVWDAWSAGTDPAGTARLLSEARARGARVAHVELAERGAGARILVVVLAVER